MEKMNCVLLVDDDEITNYLNERVIKKMDLSRNVKSSLNGEEALLYLTKYCCNFDNLYFPELIILDNNMPEMNGVEFMESLQDINLNTENKIKIVVLTAYPNPNDEKKLKRLGVHAYLVKPLTEEKLRQVMEELEAH